MIFTETPLNGAFLIDLEKRGDERGFFARAFCEREFANRGLTTEIAQANNSLSARKATLRGMHYQRAPRPKRKSSGAFVVHSTTSSSIYAQTHRLLVRASAPI